jgi:hypothetical protein
VNPPAGAMQDWGMRSLKAAVIYFLFVFAVGWVLGPIRELWVVPRFGRTTGVLLEAPIMLIAMIISARWVIRRFDVPGTLCATIYGFGCGWHPDCR